MKMRNQNYVINSIIGYVISLKTTDQIILFPIYLYIITIISKNNMKFKIKIIMIGNTKVIIIEIFPNAIKQIAWFNFSDFE